MDVHGLLRQVKTGEISLEDAEEKLKMLPYEEIGRAHV